MEPLREYAAAVIFGIQMHFLRYRLPWIVLLLMLAGAATAWKLAVSAPNEFPAGATIVIQKGESGAAIADALAAAQIVRHARVERVALRLLGSAHAGAYRFSDAEDALTIASRLSRGAFGIPPVRLTFIEGATARDMAGRIAGALPEVSAADFLTEAQPYEGYLFPDTYLLQPDATADSIVAQMRANFDAKTSSFAPSIAAAGHSLGDIVTMASIIEKETNTPEDRRIVAGILWNRIARKMPLQVDAVFGYIYNRPTYSPSLADLKIDSPYNTYKYPGLPPGPIGNPGLDSIDAAIHPAKTNYLYYLTGKDGLMHYATTYAGQLANQKAYLR